MRILIVSDSHGNPQNVEKAINMLNPDHLIFLGDGEREIENLSYIYDKITFHIIRGNCDIMSNSPASDIEIIGGYKFFITHGHVFSVKTNTNNLIAAARDRNAKFVLYGHTHIPENTYLDGLYIINPGSCSCPIIGRPSCAYIDIVGDNILTNIVRL